MGQIGEKNAQTKVQKESPRENRSRIYLPTSGIMFVTFFFHAAWQYTKTTHNKVKAGREQPDLTEGAGWREVPTGGGTARGPARLALGEDPALRLCSR